MLCGEGGGDAGGEVGVSGGGVGGGWVVRLISSVESSLISPSVPRKTSGAALDSAAGDGGEAAVVSATAAAALLLERRAARWLTLEAARVVLATLVGWARVVFRPFLPAFADSANFTVWAVLVPLLPLAGSAATSAKDFMVIGVLVAAAGTFTALAGGASLLGDVGGGGGGC